MFNFYTPDQANEILPEIKRRFSKIIDKRNEIIKIQNEINSIINGYKSFILFFDMDNIISAIFIGMIRFRS